MFAGIDLYLELQRHAFFGSYPVGQRHPSFGAFSLRAPQPGIEFLLQGIHERTDRSPMDLNQVNIFGITNRRQMEFEKRCASPEGQVFRKIGMAEDLHKGATDDQVLLHLIIMGPGDSPLPFGDEVLGDQTSASTLALTRIRQRGSWLIPVKGFDGTSGDGAGLISAIYFANSPVLFCAPTRSSR